MKHFSWHGQTDGSQQEKILVAQEELSLSVATQEVPQDQHMNEMSLSMAKHESEELSLTVPQCKHRDEISLGIAKHRCEELSLSVAPTITQRVP